VGPYLHTSLAAFVSVRRATATEEYVDYTGHYLRLRYQTPRGHPTSSPQRLAAPYSICKYIYTIQTLFFGPIPQFAHHQRTPLLLLHTPIFPPFFTPKITLPNSTGHDTKHNGDPYNALPITNTFPSTSLTSLLLSRLFRPFFHTSFIRVEPKGLTTGSKVHFYPKGTSNYVWVQEDPQESQ
jgi:hypothetical protein